jgi:serine/threonine-protein kinase
LVALKVMHPHLRGAGEARARFSREAVTVARLRHPNVLEIYDYSGEEATDDISYIATELLTGPTLKVFAEQHPEIPAEIAACFVIATARALSAAHAEGVIHRDVKPENVLLHEARTVKLTDFGIAQLVDAQSMTTTGTVLGSPGHMAPEQVEGKECDVRSDIFALGTVLYLLATGRLPFVGRNPHTVLKQIVDGAFMDPQQARPSMGGQLRRIILRAMHRDPEQRYQSAAALEQELSAFVSEVGIDDPTETLTQYLADPDAFATTFRTRVIEQLTLAGERAVKVRDVPRAFDSFNRVLALDDGNARVLDALNRLNRSSKLRTVLIAAVVAAFVGGGAVMLIRGSTNARVPQREPTPDTAGAVAARTSPAQKTSPAVRPELIVTTPQPTSVTPSDETSPIVRTRGTRPAARVPAGDGVTPRRVVFQPFPANVSIGA